MHQQEATRSDDAFPKVGQALVVTGLTRPQRPRPSQEPVQPRPDVLPAEQPPFLAVLVFYQLYGTVDDSDQFEHHEKQR